MSWPCGLGILETYVVFMSCCKRTPCSSFEDFHRLVFGVEGEWFWRGEQRHPGWWIGAGLVAGVSWAFRATNPLLFVPLFAGTVLRRETKCWALIVGG